MTVALFIIDNIIYFNFLKYIKAHESITTKCSIIFWLPNSIIESRAIYECFTLKAYNSLLKNKNFKISLVWFFFFLLSCNDKLSK